MSQNEYPGVFITFEGIEGVGKTTNLRFLAEHYHQQDIPILITREPGGTPLADEIRHFLLSEHEESIEPETELLLMFAARAQHISRVILPALAAGKAVFCDRFTDTSFAYQGAARGLGAEKIAVLQTLVQKGLTPDLTILLDAPVELALDRLQERAKTDRFESETSAFFQRARDAYLEMAIAEPERFRVIDATTSLEDVRQKMLSAINPLLEKIVA
jgi:dTMP kinase